MPLVVTAGLPVAENILSHPSAPPTAIKKLGAPLLPSSLVITVAAARLVIEPGPAVRRAMGRRAEEEVSKTTTLPAAVAAATWGLE